MIFYDKTVDIYRVEQNLIDWELQQTETLIESWITCDFWKSWTDKFENNVEQQWDETTRDLTINQEIEIKKGYIVEIFDWWISYWKYQVLAVTLYYKLNRVFDNLDCKILRLDTN